MGLERELKYSRASLATYSVCFGTYVSMCALNSLHGAEMQRFQVSNPADLESLFSKNVFSWLEPDWTIQHPARGKRRYYYYYY